MQMGLIVKAIFSELEKESRVEGKNIKLRPRHLTCVGGARDNASHLNA
jgi:hypothetical protein